MAGIGAPEGNKYAAKAKIVTDAIRKAIIQDDSAKLRKGVDRLLDAFAEGEPWAIEQVMNRLEGKPAQSVDVAVSKSIQDMTDDELLAIARGERTAAQA